VNVLSYRLSKAVVLDVPAEGRLVGDIAWGGNWFFLCQNHGLTLDLRNIPALTSLCHAIRCALVEQGLTGAGGVEIDHVELLGAARSIARRAEREPVRSWHAWLLTASIHRVNRGIRKVSSTVR